jgi:hypothetical protein
MMGHLLSMILCNWTESGALSMSALMPTEYMDWGGFSRMSSLIMYNVSIQFIA